MKQPNKNIISLLLMFSSIALLIVFQAFWLHKEYQEQYNWLQKESDALFQKTLFGLQDSLLQEKIEVALEKAQGAHSTFSFVAVDSTSISDTTSFGIAKADSAIRTRFKRLDNVKINSIEITKTPDPMPQDSGLRVGLFFKTQSDSTHLANVSNRLNRVILNVQAADVKKQLSGNVMLEILQDTLTVAQIQRAYAQALQTAELPIEFDIVKGKSDSTGNYHFQGAHEGIKTNAFPVKWSSPEKFVAIVKNYNGYLFRQIAPQILFSFFLSGITALAFWFIYRSLLQQRRLTMLKNDFISNVTHELKTPIATVSVAIEALRDFDALKDPRLTEEYLDISKNELHRLSIMVDKVLKMAIFEQKEPELRFESFNFSELVAQIVASMKLQFEKYNARVSFQTIGENLNLRGDRIHLTNVVYNLIDNALKYSKENPIIDIHLAGENGQLYLSVQDNGVGIAAEYKDRVFEKFFRVPTGDVHDTKGHGLGLSYVAKVIRKHGGVIQVESEAGVGSRFQVQLPRNEHSV